MVLVHIVVRALAGILALLVLLVAIVALAPLHYEVGLGEGPAGGLGWTACPRWMWGAVRLTAGTGGARLRLLGHPLGRQPARPAQSRTRLPGRSQARRLHAERLRLLWRELPRLGRRLVAALHLEVERDASIGLDDPALTGWLFLALSVVPHGPGTTLRADFIEPGFNGDLRLRGWLVPAQPALVVVPALLRAGVLPSLSGGHG